MVPKPLAPAEAPLAVPAFEDVYEREFAFVWRNLRRLGVAEASLHDAAQDVFLVVHRRLAEFENRAPLRSWLYSIVTRVARQYHRSSRRRDLGEVEEPDELEDVREPRPDHSAERGENVRLLLALLERLDAEKREAFVLSELEGMSVPEISIAIGVNPNTVYSRVRAARQKLEAALAEYRALERSKP